MSGIELSSKALAYQLILAFVSEPAVFVKDHPLSEFSSGGDSPP